MRAWAKRMNLIGDLVLVLAHTISPPTSSTPHASPPADQHAGPEWITDGRDADRISAVPDASRPRGASINPTERRSLHLDAGQSDLGTPTL
jgi:hypothetical protein